MSAQRIDPVLVEKAVEAFEKAPEYPGEGPDTTDRGAMEAAIRRVLNELGLKEETRGRRYRIVEGELGPEQFEFEHRFTSEWRPVEQGDAQ